MWFVDGMFGVYLLSAKQDSAVYMRETIERKAVNVYAVSELGRVLAVIENLDVPVMLLKGACLLETVYADSFDRPMCDLDLLVSEKDIGRVSQKLMDNGYRLDSHNWGNHLVFIRNDSDVSIPVELHWELFNTKHPFHRYALKVKADDFRKDAVSLMAEGHKVLMMAPEHLLIYQSLHLVNERYANEKWILDIDKIVRYYAERLNWDLLVDRSREYRVQKALWYALNAARERYGTPLREGVMERLLPDGLSEWELKLSERLCQARPLSGFHLLTLYMSLMDGNIVRVRAFLEYIVFCVKRPFMLRGNGKISPQMDTDERG